MNTDLPIYLLYTASNAYDIICYLIYVFVLWIVIDIYVCMNLNSSEVMIRVYRSTFNLILVQRVGRFRE